MRVVKIIYRADGGLSSLYARDSWLGPWNNLIRMIANLQDRGIDLLSLCPVRVTDGSSTSFWQDKMDGGYISCSFLS